MKSRVWLADEVEADGDQAGEVRRVARQALKEVEGFGPALQQFILALHIQGQVTTERLTALLTGMGVVISKRQVVRLLAKGAERFAAEDAGVLRAGLSSARWITVDDTAARHARRDGTTTHVGDHRFTAFRTGAAKSRANFLSILRAGSSDYVVNAAALDTMRRSGLPAATLEVLAGAAATEFANEAAWTAHLEALGLTGQKVTPDPVAIATEGALKGRPPPPGTAGGHGGGVRRRRPVPRQ